MAGVGNKFAPLPPILLNKKKGEPYKPRTPEDVADGKNPFARQLAHGEKDVRDATFRALGKWLGSRSDVDMLDIPPAVPAAGAPSLSHAPQQSRQ